ncbi:hypothetical protein [Methylophilus methylotrophus]|uniref:hypothetical protein n=1 Tax=Methylophilus methylotrophus TaxID=17 RepID=UPI00039DDC86|nr:hypothetical protein [Methylophilus methylotrophus]
MLSGQRRIRQVVNLQTQHTPKSHAFEAPSPAHSLTPCAIAKQSVVGDTTVIPVAIIGGYVGLAWEFGFAQA